jgi:hypothetical protein
MKWEFANKRLLGDSDVALNETLRDIDDANCATLTIFGREGWELVSVDNGIAYFKRPIDDKKYFLGGAFTLTKEKRYIYDTVQDGYVIYDNHTKLSGHEVETLLNNG